MCMHYFYIESFDYRVGTPFVRREFGLIVDDKTSITFISSLYVPHFLRFDSLPNLELKFSTFTLNA